MDADNSCSSMHDSSESSNVWSANPVYDYHPTDIRLMVEQWQFDVHKYVLEKSSDYFKAMFSSQMVETNKKSITLNLVSLKPFIILIEGMYTGKLKLTKDNIFSVTELAQMLQICSTMYDQCKHFLRLLINIDYGLEVMYLCESINMQDVNNEARRFCLAHFTELRHTQSFLNLTMSELCYYMSDDYLVVEEEMHVIEALHQWFLHKESNITQPDNFREQMKKVISHCVHLKDHSGACDAVLEAVLSKKNTFDTKTLNLLTRRPKQEDLFMFWSLLLTTKADGLVDIVRLDPKTGQCFQFDSMATIVERPGFDLGSAVCCIGPCIYLSGGGPKFGSVSWIKKIWRFDISKASSRWDTIGDLIEVRRHHAMVAARNKLYIFGGFGKFRVRNQKLHSFEISTGLWDELQPMPVHEINPAATAYGPDIFYADKNWKVHYYDTENKFWCTLTPGGIQNGQNCFKLAPICLHAVIGPKTNCLIAVVMEEGKLKIPILSVHQSDFKISISVNEIAEIENDFTYEGSAVSSGIVTVLLGCKKQDEFTGQEEEVLNHIKSMKLYDPVSKVFSDLPLQEKVRKALSVVALPHLPTTYRIDRSSLSELQDFV